MASSILNSDDGVSSGTSGLKSTGGDDGVLKIQSNGVDAVTISAGSVSVAGTSTAGADVKLYEDTDNGTNFVALKAPSSIASNVTFTLPNADGTSGQVVTTDGSGTLYFAAGGPPAGIGTLSNTQTFTSSGTWTKPGAGDWAVVRIWGGGGGGGRGGASNGQTGGGGGGGAMVEKIFKLSDLGATETVTIAAGGAGATAANTAGANGGNSTFGSLVTGYGGGGGGPGPGGQGGGGGGDASAGTQGISSVGTLANGGTSSLTEQTAVSTYYQVSSQVAPANYSNAPATMAQPPATNPFTATTLVNYWYDITGTGTHQYFYPQTKTYSFIGGAGGGGNTSIYRTVVTATPGTLRFSNVPPPLGGGASGGSNDFGYDSFWGGAGGGGGRALGSAPGGVALYLGTGSNITGGTGNPNAIAGTNGSQPACGGGGAEQANGGAGGDGQCVVWVFTS